MQISIHDLALSHHPEEIEHIVRGSEDILLEKIEIGTEEVKSYLNRFDSTTMLSPEWKNAHFKQLLTNVIMYHIVQLGLPGISYELIRERYDDAVRYLEKVQQGKLLPTWPLRPNNSGTPMDEAGNILWNSNTKRRNHY